MECECIYTCTVLHAQSLNFSVQQFIVICNNAVMCKGKKQLELSQKMHSSLISI